ncbi:ABC transporter substrate-binding protein [Natronobiforma cellulositropha]|uniref:ABC transporter substrate-binding protein n=1 Tax=Natronobiforma cellulositropha TaxID=1679076 RepID=UPI0021D5EFFE|nr:ABC transporter substrate-binding protein [Natronobiforma cellulositropha]
MNVVTTLPSATEIVAALGRLPVGVSHECDYPPAVATVPAVTRSNVDADATSGEIDRQVLETSTDANGVYELDAERLERLDPDVIVTQAICDVCAVDEAVVERTLETLACDPVVVTTDPHTVGDVLDDVAAIGDAIGREERARALTDTFESRLEAVRERAARATGRPTVAILDWTNPVMVAGHWTAELVTAAGGRYGLAERADPSRPHEWATLREYDPDVLVVAPCGFDLAQTAENRRDLTSRAGWDDLTAVRTGRVYAMDGDQYVNRPGPRLADTLEYLAGLLHPSLFETPPEDVTRPLAALEPATTGHR